jgi:hypothetical protein
VGAYRRIERSLSNAEADLGFEPLAVLIDEINDGYRGSADLSS